MFLRLVLLFSLFTSTIPALANKRMALLIGNQNYAIKSLNLKNPHNDVEVIGKALKRVGFEVRIVKDAGFRKIQREVSRYARRLRSFGKDAVGFFYYSGHGALNEQDRFNYLIPTDVETVDNIDMWDAAIRLRRIINDLKDKARNAVHFVVFDACRNELKLSTPGRKSLSQPKGFKPLNDRVQGMLIAYATAEGEIASDVGDGVGPYANELARWIVKPGVEAVTMFREVQVSVYNKLGQEPWYSHGALRRVYFAGKDVKSSMTTAIRPTAKEQFASVRRFLAAKAAQDKEVRVKYNIHIGQDINNDGFLDFAVEAEPCGSGGCGWEIYYYSTPGKYILADITQEVFVSEFNSAVFSPNSTNGWQDIAGEKLATSNDGNLVFLIYRWNGKEYKLSHYEYCENAYRVTDYHSCNPVVISISERYDTLRLAAKPTYRVSPSNTSQQKKIGFPSEDMILGKIETKPWYLVLNGFKGPASFVHAKDVLQ